MKIHSCVALLFALLLPAWAVPATPPELAEEEEVSNALTVGAGTDLVSRYVTRGVAAGEGAALQTGAWLSGRNLTLSVWNNMPLTRADGRGRVDEWDTVLAWERPWREMTLELAAARFTYPDQPDTPGTTEAALTLSRSFGPYEAYALNIVDLDAAPGAWMIELGASRAWELTPRLGLEASASVLWGNRRFHEYNAGAALRGVGAVGAGLGLPLDIGHGLRLRPHLEWIELPDGRIREAVGDRRYLTFGIALETAD